ncbi:MAG: hypothetical protein VX112_04335 [Pseudomonadota bacterium]|nr:hypothetical protein [Pseudomonadota bacterium]
MPYSLNLARVGNHLDTYYADEKNRFLIRYDCQNEDGFSYGLSF